jgi:hypothetical protein
LQNVYKQRTNKEGESARSGPYWYYQTVHEGKINTLYIGRCSFDEAKRRVDAKLREESV